MACEHEEFDANVAVQRLGDDGVVHSFIAEVSIRCARCGEPFHFVGPPAGISFKHPTVNVGATTLHAPIAPGVTALPQRIQVEVPEGTVLS